jgi:ABC-type hemin transport system ATPase subunit
VDRGRRRLALEHADQLIALQHGRTLRLGAVDAPAHAEALEAAFLGEPR